MSMKPCTHEQDVLLAIHGEAGALTRLQVAFHCLTCGHCRRRRSEFQTVTTALAALGPTSGQIARVRAVTANGVRLALIAAAIALAAAALSYYYTVVEGEPHAVYVNGGYAAKDQEVAGDDCAGGAVPPAEKRKGKAISKAAQKVHSGPQK